MTGFFISCKLTRLDNVALTALVPVSRNTRSRPIHTKSVLLWRGQ